MIRSLVRALVDAIVGALIPTDTPYVATERLSNRGFTDGAGWTIEGASWTIAGGVATSGTLVADAGLTQSFSLVTSGTSGTFLADVTNATDVVFRIRLLMDGVIVQTIYQDNPEPEPSILSVPFTASAEFNGIRFVANSGLVLDNVSLIA